MYKLWSLLDIIKLVLAFRQTEKSREIRIDLKKILLTVFHVFIKCRRLSYFFFFTPCELFTLVWLVGFSLGSKWQQVSVSRIFNNLADLRSVVVGTISIFPLISNSFQSLFQVFEDRSSTLTTIDITFTFQSLSAQVFFFLFAFSFPFYGLLGQKAYSFLYK